MHHKYHRTTGKGDIEIKLGTCVSDIVNFLFRRLIFGKPRDVNQTSQSVLKASPGNSSDSMMVPT